MRPAKGIVKLETSAGDNRHFSPDIIRLLDVLARIEIRRQAKQRSLGKDKAS